MRSPLQRWIPAAAAIGLAFGMLFGVEEGESEAPAEERIAVSSAAPGSVYVIPIRDQIGRPILYILRRGLKEAIEAGADTVVLDMDTPGGALNVTLDILEALQNFTGLTITLVNSEAISAGAFIAAATDEIWFTPRGIIGAAAPVAGGGQEIPEAMQQKLVSYLKARVRAVSEDKGYRGQVISAMIDADYEFKIGDEVIKPPGELLSLTAREAMREYGDPPQALLGAGIAADLDELLMQRLGTTQAQVVALRVTWSERLAQYLNAISPILMGLGMLALLIEFKTPGFGIFGFGGLVLLGVVFLGQHVAGLSGHEPLLFFALGLFLVLGELFLFPGLVIPALTGFLLMVGSLIWAMADIWPNRPVTFSPDLFLRPVIDVGLGLVIAIALAVALLRYLPRGMFLDRLILQGSVGGGTSTGAAAVAGPGVPPDSRPEDALVGREAVAVTDLFPSGEVEIDGKRYSAHLEIGDARAGETVVVVARSTFGLRVEPKRK